MILCRQSVVEAKMNRNFFLKWRTAFCLVAVSVIVPAAVGMDIIEYEKMVDGDRQAFLDFLVDTVQEVLVAHGRDNDAAKVYRLFHGHKKGELYTEGEKLFKESLDALRTLDTQRRYSNHNAPRAQVESALVATLKRNRITLSTDMIKELLQTSSRFNPRFPAEKVPDL